MFIAVNSVVPDTSVTLMGVKGMSAVLEVIDETSNSFLKVNGTGVALTQAEMKVLKHLLGRTRGRFAVSTKLMLMKHLYGADYKREVIPGSKIIDVLICKLRKKIAEVAGEDFVPHVWGRGWMLHEVGEEGLAPPVRPTRAGVVRDDRGRLLSAADLPRMDCRWTLDKKRIVLTLIRQNILTMEEAWRTYRLSESEYLEWHTQFQVHGASGLRVSRTNEYLKE